MNDVVSFAKIALVFVIRTLRPSLLTDYQVMLDSSYPGCFT